VREEKTTTGKGYSMVARRREQARIVDEYLGPLEQGGGRGKQSGRWNDGLSSL
jgi:hypothetical protein